MIAGPLRLAARPIHNVGMLQPGGPLPSFTALDDHGTVVDSSDWNGKWTVLWWYVKADTPG